MNDEIDEAERRRREDLELVPELARLRTESSPLKLALAELREKRRRLEGLIEQLQRMP